MVQHSFFEKEISERITLTWVIQHMKFGLSLGNENFQGLVKSAINAEKQGFDSLWVADMSRRDVFVTLSTLALNTKRLLLGTSVTNPFSRHPFHIAQAMASINEISNGRVILGIGCGSKKNLLAPLSIDRTLPIQTVKESVIVIKKLLMGDKIRFTGKTIRVKDAKLDIVPNNNFPIYIGARGSGMLEVAGEIADGVIISSLANPTALKYALNCVKLGVLKAGRKYSDIHINIFVRICVSNDSDSAKQSMRKHIPYRIWDDAWSTLNKLGYDRDVVNAVRKAFEASNLEAASALVTDQMVEDFGITGTLDECIKKIRKFEKVGVYRLIVIPLSSGMETRDDVTEIIAGEIMPKC